MKFGLRKTDQKKKFATLFLRARKIRISLDRLKKEEELRWKSCIAKTSMTIFVALHKMLVENEMDFSHFCNLISTTVPQIKKTGRLSKKHVMRTEEVSENMAIVFAFKNFKRNDDFISENCNILWNQLQTRRGVYSQVLLCGSLIAIMEGTAGIESSDFCLWVEKFMKSLKKKIKVDKEVLLLSYYYKEYLGI